MPPAVSRIAGSGIASRICDRRSASRCIAAAWPVSSVAGRISSSARGRIAAAAAKTRKLATAQVQPSPAPLTSTERTTRATPSSQRRTPKRLTTPRASSLTLERAVPLPISAEAWLPPRSCVSSVKSVSLRLAVRGRAGHGPRGPVAAASPSGTGESRPGGSLACSSLARACDNFPIGPPTPCPRA